MSGEGKVVCVTGASGYVASWLVKLLLEDGYTVKATVRNLSDPRKIAHLKALEGAEERLQFFEANLTEDGSFDSVIDGCDGVFHTASPAVVIAADPQAEIIGPAVEGTLNVLRSCSKASSVRRVVLTSSTASLFETRTPKGPDVVVDETWFSDPVLCQEEKNWYALSKTLADRAAWEFAEENGIDLVVIHPGFILGPPLQPTLNTSCRFVVDIVKGKEVFPYYLFVDVRDAVRAHILAFENPSASGKYVVVGKPIKHSQTLQIVHKLYPSISGRRDIAENEPAEPPFQVSQEKAKTLGLKFTPIEVSLKYTVESLKEKNLITL